VNRVKSGTDIPHSIVSTPPQFGIKRTIHSFLSNIPFTSKDKAPSSFDLLIYHAVSTRHHREQSDLITRAAPGFPSRLLYERMYTHCIKSRRE
jgi:hypothetical protein